MPQCCSVPLCSERGAGHKFPTDKARLKKWLVAIRRDKFKPTKNSRVCKKHFTSADYVFPKDSVRRNPLPILRKDAVPSCFPWTVKPSDAKNKRNERLAKRQQFRIQPSPLVGNDQVQTNFVGECSEKESVIVLNDITPECVEVETTTKDIGVQCSLIECDVVKPFSSETDNIHMMTTSEMKETSENGSTDETSTKSSTEGTFKLRIASIQCNPEMVKFYTGFDDYDHFMFLFHLFSEEACNLRYYPNMQPALHTRVLLPIDEFLMTIMKLRRNMGNTELSFLFGVSKSTVSNVFITWINFLYCQLKELNIWASRPIIEQNMKFRGKSCPCTVIIDCTEIKIEKPKNPISQQLTYSSYKSANTLKVLIGISPSGAVTFISDAYGGAISDRELFEKCGIIDLLQDGDVIFCDRGFNVQDLVAHKNVTVNMPEFLDKNAGQFSPVQLRKSKKISSHRIHVERLIGLAQTYRILCSTLVSTLVPLGSRIIFVCFMLTNFRRNIVL